MRKVSQFKPTVDLNQRVFQFTIRGDRVYNLLSAFAVKHNFQYFYRKVDAEGRIHWAVIHPNEKPALEALYGFGWRQLTKKEMKKYA